MNLKDMLTEKPHPLHWGGTFGLWDICRHKIIGIPVLELLHNLAEDKELKNLIKIGIETQALPHIEKMQEFLQSEDLPFPPTQQRKNMNDQQIALAIMEILRLSLILDNIAFTNVTRGDLRKFIWNITEDDKKAFDRVIDLLYKNNWTLNPPSS